MIDTVEVIGNPINEGTLTALDLLPCLLLDYGLNRVLLADALACAPVRVGVDMGQRGIEGLQFPGGHIHSFASHWLSSIASRASSGSG